jgi:hypothetical protein
MLKEGNTMGTIFKYSAALLTIMLVCPGFVRAASKPPAVGDQLPEFTLPVPKNDEQQKYLGLAGKESFKISEIKAEVVIIEIFNMY